MAEEVTETLFICRQGVTRQAESRCCKQHIEATCFKYSIENLSECMSAQLPVMKTVGGLDVLML